MRITPPSTHTMLQPLLLLTARPKAGGNNRCGSGIAPTPSGNLQVTVTRIVTSGPRLYPEFRQNFRTSKPTRGSDYPVGNG